MPLAELDELKEYIRDTLGAEMSRLSRSIDEQNSMLRNIEIRTTTEIVEIRKDIQQLKEAQTALATEQRSNEESQKLKWKELAKRQEEDQKQQAEAGKILDRAKMLTNLMWFFIAMAATLVFGFFWQIFLAGGIKNLP